MGILSLLHVILAVSGTVYGTPNTLPTLRVPLGVSLQTFDPSEAEDFITMRILMNLGQGLVSLGKSLEPLPGQAGRWSISKDKTTYTFFLKKNFWSDGQPVTTDDFIRGFERTLSPQTVAKTAVNFMNLVKGASDYKSGLTKNFSHVGIKADGKDKIVITLNHPADYFLPLLALPICFPQREGHPQIKVGTPINGAFWISELKPTNEIRLAPNANFEHPPKTNVLLKIVSDQTTALGLYEQGELDVLEKIPSPDFRRFSSKPDLISAPFLATYYLAFNVTKPPFSNRTLREALARSFHRRDLNIILKDRQNPSSSLVPKPLESSGEEFGPSYDPKKARALWNSVSDHPAGFELPFDSQEKNILIMSWIQNEFKKTLGAEIRMHSMEWKAYLKFLTEEKPSIYRFAWLATFPDPLSHLGVFTSRNPNNYTGYANPKYDQLVEKIAKAPRGAARSKMIREAQRKLMGEDVVVMPLYHYVQYDLISSKWRGLELTPMGLLYFGSAQLK